MLFQYHSYTKHGIRNKMFNKINHKLLIISHLFLIYCSTKLPINHPLKRTKLTIKNIDSTTLKTAYLIDAIIKNREILIHSEKKLNTQLNSNKLIIGKHYYLILKEVFYLQLDDLSFPLYKGNIYLDNKLIIKKETKVFVSEDINGLYLIN